MNLNPVVGRRECPLWQQALCTLTKFTLLFAFACVRPEVRLLRGRSKVTRKEDWLAHKLRALCGRECGTASPERGTWKRERPPSFSYSLKLALNVERFACRCLPEDSHLNNVSSKVNSNSREFHWKEILPQNCVHWARLPVVYLRLS